MNKLRLVVLLLAVDLLQGAVALAQDTTELTRQPVTGNISMVTGNGGNIGLFIGPDGTFLVDDQFAPVTERLLEIVREAGGDTPRFLLNTHFHGDHTGGNENLGKLGSLIISHDNVRERLANPSVIAAFNMRTPAQPAAALPVVTFSRDMTLHINDETVRLIHLPQGHTDGDSFVVFETANVIHAGDVFFSGMFPFIDVDHGGTLQGAIAGIEQILRHANDQTRIIPGHGPLSNRAALQAYHGMLETAYLRLNALRNDGKSLEEAVALKPLADLDATWGKGLFTADKWIGVVYHGVY